MKTEIKGGPAFCYVDIELAPGETLLAESDAMSSMAADIDMQAQFNGGFMKAILRKLFGGETLFLSRFSNNTQGPRRMTIVQPTPGEIRCLELTGESFRLQPGAFIAATEGVKLGLQWAGFVSWLAKEGLFRLVVSGAGKVFYGAYGALIDKEIDGEYIVDSSHLVGYDPGIKLHLQLAGGLFSSIFGGEGLVTRVSGRGKIVIQTRSLPSLAAWLNPKFWG